MAQETPSSSTMSVSPYSTPGKISPSPHSLPHTPGYLLKENISSIQKHEIVARGSIDALIHSIVKSLVGFWVNHNFMSIFTCLRLMLVSLDHRQGFVLRHPIYNQVLHVAISLLAHTIQVRCNTLSALNVQVTTVNLIIGDSFYRPKPGYTPLYI